MEILAPHAPLIPDASAMATVVEASQDPLASEVPAGDKLVEAHRDSNVDPIFETAEAPYPDIVSA